MGCNTATKTSGAGSRKSSRPAGQAAAVFAVTLLTDAAAHATRDQQRLLYVFADVFGDVLAAADFASVVRDVKQALYRREFAAAFAGEARLDAYAARWSPTRALCYARVLRDLRHHLRPLGEGGGRGGADAERASAAETSREAVASAETLTVLSVGGCAAEHVALASYLHGTASRGVLTLLDVAPWSRVTSRLQQALTSSPGLSSHASAAAKVSNRPLLADAQLTTTFHQIDVLSLSCARLARLAGPNPLLVTLFFTLNELYTVGGLGKTTAFVRTLSGALPSRSLLLVVDSPGSYSEAAIGKDKKRYPMQWLLDHTLLDTETPNCRWEKLESHDSVWFRLPEVLSYPMQLEDMRYQMHLYRIHTPKQPGGPHSQAMDVPF